MTTTTLSPARRTAARRRIPLAVTVSAWAAPVLVVGQFSLVAALPVTIALVGSLLRVRDRTVRVTSALLTAAYAVPLVTWLVRPDGAPSLSKDMHPGFTGLIVAASVALIVAVHRTGRR
ncbi:hypothetical protein ABZX40_04535 [Streptomyces sp. NPDC004610]|uniref:hypothetical protein n=1 Tax=unclassified Streptomyces TaxID=2593676 RepID=UPI0033B9343A